MSTESFDVGAIGEDVPLLEGIRTTRAMRRLRPDPVPRELIRKVCEAGTFAPSGGNRQPWFFIAVTEARAPALGRRPLPSRLSRLHPAGPRGGEGSLVSRGQAPQHARRDPPRRSSARGAGAAVRRRLDSPRQAAVQALFPAVQNVLLACRAVGLGASLTTLHTTFGKEVDEWLGLPENCPTCAMLPIGWPLGRYARPPRRSIDTCLFFERFQA